MMNYKSLVFSEKNIYIRVFVFCFLIALQAVLVVRVTVTTSVLELGVEVL